MNEYEKRFALLENEKLLKVLQDAKKYLPEAIDAAKAELEKRDLSEAEIEAFQQASKAKQSVIDSRNRKLKEVENQITHVGSELYDTVRPIHEGLMPTHRKIHLVVVLFAFLAVKSLVTNAWALKGLFRGGFAFGFSHLIPFFLMTLIAFLWWKEKRSGWVLSTMYLTGRLVENLHALLTRIIPHKEESFDSLIYENDYESFFPEINPVYYLSLIFFYGAFLWFVNNRDLRDSFGISKLMSLLTIGITAAFFVVLILMAEWS